MNRHRWTEQDDIIALYFYKFGELGLTSSVATVGERLGMGAGSLRMRVGNFRAIAGGGRLDHTASQSKEFHSTSLLALTDLRPAITPCAGKTRAWY